MKQLLVELKDINELPRQLENILKERDTGKYSHILLHIYSGLEEAQWTEQIAAALHSLIPEAGIVGTMSAGEIMEGHVIKKGVLVGALFFESTRAEVVRFDNVKGNESAAGKRIREYLDSVPDIKAAEFILPGTELETKALFDEISACRSDILIFGGYSGGHAMNAAVHYAFDADGIKYDAIFVTVFAGENIHIDMDKVIGWEALGVPFTVTKADGHRLIELDGRPASEIYERFLHIDRRLQNNAQEGYTFPLLAEYKGDEWLRSAIHIEEDGSLNLHGHVEEGMEIQLSYGNPVTIVNKVNERLKAVRSFKPQVVLIYSCIVRKTFWDNYMDLELVPYEKLCSTAGFYTWGEIMRNMNTGEIVEHNVTQLSIAMREGDAPAWEFPDAKADDSVLKGPAAQLKRLTSLVYTAMEELQDAQKDLSILNEKLRVMAETDALTGLCNRGKTEEIIKSVLSASACDGFPVSLLMLDIDHFKAVNDNYSHQTGDSVLREVADILLEFAKEHEGAKAGRWGGEEFFVVLPHLDSERALEAAELLRKRIQDHDFAEVGNVTVSIGVITAPGNTFARDIFTSVDKALYCAKESGRNRVVQAQELNLK